MVVRRDARVRISFGQHGFAKELLSPLRTSDMEMLMLIIEPDGGSGPEPWVRREKRPGLSCKVVWS